MKRALLLACVLLAAGCAGVGLVAPPPQGGSLSVDGDGDYVEVAFANDLNTLSAITIEAWVKPDATYCCPTVVGNGWTRSYWLGLGWSVIRFYHGDRISVDGTTGIRRGQWTHIAVTYDGTTRRYYVNGQLDIETTASNGPVRGNSPPVWLGIGGDFNGGYWFSGLIDEVRIWNVVRSQAEIQADMRRALDGLQPGLLATWHFDTNAQDAVGNHHGTLRGDAGFSSEGFPRQ